MQAATFDHPFMPVQPCATSLINFRIMHVFAQPCKFCIKTSTQYNIGTTACHIGCNGHGTRRSSLFYNMRFTFMLFGIEHFMLNLLFAQQCRNDFRIFNRSRSYQDGLPTTDTVFNILGNGNIFFLLSQINQVPFIITNHWPVRRDNHHLKTIYLIQFERLGIGCTSHTGKLLVQAEIVLESDRCQSLVFILNRDVFLGFNRLMQTIRPAPASHHTPGKLINDDHFIILDDVINILMKQYISPHSRIHIVHQANICRIIKAAALRYHAMLSKQLLNPFMSFFSKINLPGFFINRIIARPVLLFLLVQKRNNFISFNIVL